VNFLEWAIILPISAVGAFLFLGALGYAIETLAEHSAQHDHCLKRATNGYEIRQCR
jgi:hypothetical protein